MEIIQSVILGIVQGLTEFLPISSSAHLILLPQFFSWTDPGLAFDVALHLGSLLAVITYFHNDLKELIIILWRQLTYQPSTKIHRYNNKMAFWLILATLPGALVGYFLNDLAEHSLRNPSLIAFTLVFFGGWLYWSDKIHSGKKKIKNINLKDTLIIGLAQALAIIPGTSRSGITITAGMLLGFTRTTAARFSFLLSIPIIAGAVIYKVPALFNNGLNLVVVVGILSSLISSYLAIAGLMKFINQANYRIFFWYRTFLAIIILLFLIF